MVPSVGAKLKPATAIAGAKDSAVVVYERATLCSDRPHFSVANETSKI